MIQTSSRMLLNVMIFTLEISFKLKNFKKISETHAVCQKIENSLGISKFVRIFKIDEKLQRIKRDRSIFFFKWKFLMFEFKEVVKILKTFLFFYKYCHK